MAHRLAHLNKKQNVYQQQTDSYQTQSTNNEPSFVPSTTKTKNPENQSDKMPRPIFPSANQIQIYEKNGFRKGLPTFPAPQSLFEAENNYDASPQFIRPTSVVIHNTPKKSIFPLGAWITPFGVENVPSVNVQSPLRCHRCKAYVNPYFQFDGSRKLTTCNICGMKFQVDENIDRKNLQATQIATRGVIDFVVKDKFYHMKRTDIIKIIICIEFSQPMMQLGIFNTVIEGIKSSIENSSFEQKIRIGVMYFGQEGIVFPKLRKGENWQQTQMSQYVIKVTENSTFCCPLSDSQFLLDPNNQKEKLTYLLDQISLKADTYYQKGRFVNSANYVAALKCLKESFENETGRVMLFSCLDPRTGKCSVRPRNEQQTKLPLKPIHNEFYQLSKELLKARIGVQHFIFTKDNMISHQLATVHFLSSQTSGLLHFYPSYHHENNSQHLYYTIFKSLSKPFAYDIDYTCRVSNGMNIMSFCTTNGIRQVRDVSMGCMDSGHGLAVIFEHEEKIEQSYGGFLQFAMMYTTGNGQRRIRVINFRYLISSRLENVYQSIDYLAVANILTRQYTTKLFTNEPNKVRQQLVNKLASIIAQYKFKCSPPMQGAKYSDLGAPQNLKLALAYLHVIGNSKLFTNPLKLTSDYRIAQILKMNSMDFFSYAMKYYPKLYPLTMDIYENEPLPGDFINPVEEDEQENEQQQEQIAVLPQNLPLTKSSIKDYGVYLHNDGEYLTMCVMPNADGQLLNELFGTTDWDQIQSQGLPQLQGSHSIRVNIIINELRRRNSANNSIYLPLLIKTPLKKGPFGELVNNIAKQDYHECNYYTFLDQLHRLAQTFGK